MDAIGLTAKFTRSSLSTIERAARTGALRVSVMSIWEIGMLESKGRLELKMNFAEWVRQALATPGLSLVPLTPEIAIESCLGNFTVIRPTASWLLRLESRESV